MKYQWILRGFTERGEQLRDETGWANNLDFTSEVILYKSRWPSAVRIVIDIALPLTERVK